MSEPQRILITGGAGFLGRAVLRELQQPAAGGDAPERIRIFDARPPGFDPGPGVTSIVGDVRSREDVARACEGMDVVLHTASLVDYGHASPSLLDEINVEGTRNVIEACREGGVRGLVYTSTMDVVVGAFSIRDGDETVPYPKRFADHYARTKAEAEQLALAADGDALRTCVLRPCGMFGEADPYHVSNVLRAVRDGSVSFRVGDGSAVFQHVYVGNVAYAHVLAARRLLEAGSPVPGEVYIVTDTPAVNFFDFLAPICERLGSPLPPKSRSIPYPIAYAVGAGLELAARLLRPIVSFRPQITRSSVQILCHDVSFTGEKARRDLGYAPRYSHAESLDRTVEWFRKHSLVKTTRLDA